MFELHLLVHKAPGASRMTQCGRYLSDEFTYMWSKWTKEIGPPIMLELLVMYQPFAIINGVSWFCVYYDGMDDWEDRNSREWLRTLELVLTRFDSSPNKWVELSRIVCAENILLPLLDLKIGAVCDSIFVVSECRFNGGGWNAKKYSLIVFDNVTSEIGNVSVKCDKIVLVTSESGDVSHVSVKFDRVSFGRDHETDEDENDDETDEVETWPNHLFWKTFRRHSFHFGKNDENETDEDKTDEDETDEDEEVDKDKNELWRIPLICVVEL